MRSVQTMLRVCLFTEADSEFSPQSEAPARGGSVSGRYEAAAVPESQNAHPAAGPMRSRTVT